MRVVVLRVGFRREETRVECNRRDKEYGSRVAFFFYFLPFWSLITSHFVHTFERSSSEIVVSEGDKRTDKVNTFVTFKSHFNSFLLKIRGLNGKVKVSLGSALPLKTREHNCIQNAKISILYYT